MAIEKELNRVIELSRESAMEKIKGQEYFEKDTHRFFNALVLVLNGINKDVNIKDLKDLIQPNFQPIYMLMKASKKEEISILVYTLNEDDFRMKNMHSLNAIENALLDSE